MFIMKFAKWIILVVLFASTDSVPLTPDQPPTNLNYTRDLNDVFSELFNSPPSNRKEIFLPRNESYIEGELKTRSKHDKLYNVTMKTPRFETESGLKNAVISFDDWKISKQMPSVIVEARLEGFNHHIATEKFTISYAIKLAQGVLSADLILEQDIKLNTTDYQYKPDEEAQIKNEIETYIKKAFNESFTKSDEHLFRGINHILLQIFNKVLNNKQERYYYIGSIPSTNCTLNNVTVYGLWNLKSISYNASHLQAYPTAEMGAVRGWMMQNHASSSVELNFNADNIYISVDQNVSKVNVKLEAYSVVNAKSNTSLTNDQSKFIIKDIESAFEASVESAWKSSKKYVPLQH